MSLIKSIDDTPNCEQLMFYKEFAIQVEPYRKREHQ
jgi:hypothetical protein